MELKAKALRKGHKLTTSTAITATGLFVDVNSSVHMKPWGSLKGMVTNSHFYSFEREAMLSAKDHLKILGYDVSSLRFDGIDDKAIRDLAGNGNCLHQTTIAVACMALCLPLQGVWTHQ